MSKKRLVVAHVVWMDAYQGDAGTVKNVGHRFKQAAHLDEESGEIFNFSPISGRCNGYVPRFTPTGEFKKMNIDRIGASSRDESLDGVTVIWTATPGPGEQRVVVGWYEDATAYRIPKEGLDPARPTSKFYFSAPSDRCYLIPAELRDRKILLSKKSPDRDGPGNDALYYPKKRVSGLLKRYIASAPAQIVGKPQDQKPTKPHEPGTRPSTQGPRQPDIEIRLAAEKAAMEAVKRALDSGNWEHTDVSAKYTGWDITANRKGSRSLRVEVKGLSGSLATVELTPNEYEKLGYDVEHKKQDRYVIAIVTDALDLERIALQCFSLRDGKWLPFAIERGVHLTGNAFCLRVTEIKAARCSVVLLPRA